MEAAEPGEGPPPLSNLKEVDGGYYISGENIIKLANYIQDLREENTKLQALADKLNNVLQEEREAIQRLIAEKDNVIVLQKEQIKDYRELYKNKDPGIFQKASWAAGGAGIASVLIMLATLSK